MTILVRLFVFLLRAFNHRDTGSYRKRKRDDEYDAPPVKATSTHYEDRHQEINTFDRLYDEINYLLNTMPASELEVEARIGLQSSSGFSSGVTRQEFNVLKRSLLSDSTLSLETTDVIDRFSSIHGEKYRWSYNDQGEVLAVLKKRRLKNLQHNLDDLYGWRISISSEIQEPPTRIISEGSRMADRHKKRFSFKEKKDPLWVIDMTEVKTNEAVTYEVEIELLSLDNLGEKIDALEAIIDRIHNLVLRSGGDGFPDIVLQGLTDDEESLFMDDYHAIFNQQSKEVFLGTFPTPLPDQYKDVRRLGDQYFICDHPTGSRCMIFFHTSMGVFLITDKGSVYRISQLERLCEYLAIKGHTIIDCELVRHRNTYEPYFLIFDCICRDGIFLGNERYKDRIRRIGEIVAIFRDKIKEPSISLMGKFITPLRDVRKLFANMQLSSEDKYYDDGKRCHSIKGYIFIPMDMKYEPGQCKYMYKCSARDRSIRF